MRGPPGPRTSANLSYVPPSGSRFVKRVNRLSVSFLLVVVYYLVIRVDDILLLVSRGLRRACWLRAGRGSAGATLRGIERRARRRVRLLQLVERLRHLVRAARAERLLRRFDRLVEPGLERAVELVGPFLRVLLHFVHQRVEAVARSEEHTSELQSPCNLLFRLL